MAAKIRLVIFDLDGTLVNAYKAVAQSVNFSLKKMGYPSLTDETIKRSVGWGDKNLISRFVTPTDVDGVLAIYRRHHKKSLKTGTKFLPGAKKLLFKLKKNGYRLAIASNRPSFYTKIILKHLNISSLFSCVICADQVKRGKPAGDILKEILKKLLLKPHEALYVGDMTIDVQAGQKAGIKTVAVVTGSSFRKEVVSFKPFKIINSIGAIEGVLQKIDF